MPGRLLRPVTTKSVCSPEEMKHGCRFDPDSRHNASADAVGPGRTRAATAKAPLAMAEICDASCSVPARSGGDHHDHEGLESVGRWASPEGDQRSLPSG